jgi:hypothetical protein
VEAWRLGSSRSTARQRSGLGLDDWRDLVDPDHDPTKRSGSLLPPDMIEDSLHDTAHILVPVNISLGLPQTPPFCSTVIRMRLPMAVRAGLTYGSDSLRHICPKG